MKIVQKHLTKGHSQILWVRNSRGGRIFSAFSEKDHFLRMQMRRRFTMKICIKNNEIHFGGHQREEKKFKTNYKVTKNMWL